MNVVKKMIFCVFLSTVLLLLNSLVNVAVAKKQGPALSSEAAEVARLLKQGKEKAKKTGGDSRFRCDAGCRAKEADFKSTAPIPAKEENTSSSLLFHFLQNLSLVSSALAAEEEGEEGGDETAEVETGDEKNYEEALAENPPNEGGRTAEESIAQGEGGGIVSRPEED